jgi:hypothetical protein
MRKQFLNPEVKFIHIKQLDSKGGNYGISQMALQPYARIFFNGINAKGRRIIYKYSAFNMHFCIHAGYTGN